MPHHIARLALVAPLALTVITATAMAREPGIPRGEKTFARLDKDHNGKIELSELQPAAVRRFMGLDHDADGKVTRGEIEDWLRAAMERRLDRIMTRMDADNDSAITRDELEAYVAGQFGNADVNADGGVTHDEAKAYHVAKRKKYWAERKKARAGN
jgi:Ca2+-binding EF-hand superfamily protein